jgi:tRNA threonylcarbamoyladenosine biosynthesis protein TsaB
VHLVEVTPSARGLVKPAYEAYRAKKFEDIAYFEPFYLKDFVVTPSLKKIF